MKDSAIFKHMRNAYDRIVQEYALRNHDVFPENLAAIAQMLIEHAGQNGHIVDIGCGTGRDMVWFEAHGVKVTGIDLSPGMLVFARRHVHGCLGLMNMCHLGFASNSFDGAWCCASLLHLPKHSAPRALNELRRVLKIGSMMVLELQEGSGETWEESYVPGVNRFVARYQPDEIIELVSGCGFSLQQTDRAQNGERKWLSCVCIAER